MQQEHSSELRLTVNRSTDKASVELDVAQKQLASAQQQTVAEVKRIQLERKSLSKEIEQGEKELELKITICQETEGFGTAGSLKMAEDHLVDKGAGEAPFFVVNSDVLCSYPLRDLLHVHMKARSLPMLWCEAP